MKVFLIVMYVTGGTYEVLAERLSSSWQCQKTGREFAESLLIHIPAVERVSFKCVEVSK